MSTSKEAAEGMMASRAAIAAITLSGSISHDTNFKIRALTICEKKRSQGQLFVLLVLLGEVQ